MNKNSNYVLTTTEKNLNTYYQEIPKSALSLQTNETGIISTIGGSDDDWAGGDLYGKYPKTFIKQITAKTTEGTEEKIEINSQISDFNLSVEKLSNIKKYSTENVGKSGRLSSKKCVGIEDSGSITSATEIEDKVKYIVANSTFSEEKTISDISSYNSIEIEGTTYYYSCSLNSSDSKNLYKNVTVYKQKQGTTYYYISDTSVLETCIILTTDDYNTVKIENNLDANYIKGLSKLPVLVKGYGLLTILSEHLNKYNIYYFPATSDIVYCHEPSVEKSAITFYRARIMYATAS